MAKGTWWEYQSTSPENQRKFDSWLKANTILSLIIALGMLAMALAAITSTSPKSSNVAAGVRNELANGAAGRESAGVNLKPTGRDSQLVTPVIDLQPSR
jgi:hypothetical protein